jgi:hypothetical protein
MKKLGLFFVFAVLFTLGMSAQTQQDPPKSKKGTPKPVASVGQKPTANAPTTATQTQPTATKTPKNTVPRRRMIARKPVQAKQAPAKKETMSNGQ